MAVRKILWPMESGLPEFYTYYVCDLIAELPSSGLNVGELAISLEGPKLYVAVNDTTWRELTKASASGYAGTGMLGSGSADGTKFLCGNQSWAVPPGGGGPATQITTTDGPTVLDVGSITDGQYLRRSGATVIGGNPGGSASVTAKTINSPYGVYEYSETFSDVGVSTSSKILAYLGQTSSDDENEPSMDDLAVSAYAPSNGNLTLTVSSEQPFGGPIKLVYLIGA